MRGGGLLMRSQHYNEHVVKVNKQLAVFNDPQCWAGRAHSHFQVFSHEREEAHVPLDGTATLAGTQQVPCIVVWH